MSKAVTARRSKENVTLRNTILEKQEKLHHIRELNTLARPGCGTRRRPSRT